MSHTLQIQTVVLLLASGLTLPAQAQLGNPAGTDPGSAEVAPGNPAPGELNAQDRLFIQLATKGNVGEIATGRLAVNKSGNEAVQTFARRMVQDHGTTRDKLGQMARGRDVPVPDAPQPDQQEHYAWLESLSGAAFDVAYLQSQLIDHQKMVQLLEWEINTGQDAALKLLAVDTLPVVLDHLRAVQLLTAEVTGAPAQGLATAAPQTQVRR